MFPVHCSLFFPAQKAFRGGALLGVFLVGLIALTLHGGVSPATASRLYKYTDEAGTEHFTENMNDIPAGARSIEFVSSRPAAPSGRAGAPPPKGATPLKVDYGADTSKVAALQEILTLYRLTHTYSQEDFFVCADMAIDVWNMAKTKGFTVMIAAGNPDDGKATPQKFNHAWVVAEVAPATWLAMETTAGKVVSGQENANYYRGHFFDNPRTFKAYLDERRGGNQQITEVRELEEKFTRMKGTHDAEREALGKLNDEFTIQCAEKRLASSKFKRCSEMQQTLLSKIAQGKELEGRLKQLADAHTAATERLEQSLRLFNQPIQSITPR